MRKFLAAALAALLTLSLGACGNGGDAASGASSADPDLDGLFTELSALCGEAAVDIDALRFASTLGFAIDPATAAGLYGVEESEVFACQAAGGVSADEATIFQCADETRAAEVLAIAETRLADQAESYADYLPEEAVKLQNAAAVRSGSVVAVCVCADAEKAAELIRNYLG